MPMISNPTAGDLHVNKPLTNFGQKYLQSATNFVSMRAMPSMPVAHQSDLYWKWNRGDFLRNEAAIRADGAESAGGGFRLDTDSYYAYVYAYHKDVTDRQRANADPQISLDTAATQFVTHKMLLKREQLFLDEFFVTGVWGTDTNVTGGAAADAWDTTTGDPIKQIRAATSAMQGATGFRPNRALASRDAWDALMDNDAVLDRIVGGASTDVPAIVMRRLIAQLFEIDSIEVVDSVVNSAVRDADPTAESTAFAGNAEQFLLYYAPQSLGLEEPTAGAIFNWTGAVGNTSAGLRIKRFRMEANEADRVEGQIAFAQKVVAPELGTMLYNVLT